jgi:hypothetical protein
MESNFLPSSLQSLAPALKKERVEHEKMSPNKLPLSLTSFLCL